jgi:hypothetical protein
MDHKVVSVLDERGEVGEGREWRVENEPLFFDGGRR